MTLDSQEFRKNINPPRWPNGKTGHQYAPPDTPLCGFRNELCPVEQGMIDIDEFIFLARKGKDSNVFADEN